MTISNQRAEMARAGAMIFRGGEARVDASCVSLTQSSSLFLSLYLSFVLSLSLALRRNVVSPPWPSRRRCRSPLSGVSDGYEILRAVAAKWHPRGKLFLRRSRRRRGASRRGVSSLSLIAPLIPSFSLPSRGYIIILIGTCARARL